MRVACMFVCSLARELDGVAFISIDTFCCVVCRKGTCGEGREYEFHA